MSDRQSTHWEGCWQFDHHEKCARERIHVLETRLAEAQAACVSLGDQARSSEAEWVRQAIEKDAHLAAMREALEKVGPTADACIGSREPALTAGLKLIRRTIAAWRKAAGG